MAEKQPAISAKTTTQHSLTRPASYSIRDYWRVLFESFFPALHRTMIEHVYLAFAG